MKQYRVSKISKFNSWIEIESLRDFSSPWSDEKTPKTEFKAYHDDSYLYFQFIAYDNKPPLVYVENNNKLEVRYSERVELFFRSDKTITPYYCLEMDPSGRVLDYKARMYRDFNRDWIWPEPLNIKIEITDEFYSLQGAISLSALKQLNLIKNRQLQVGVYRGHCINLLKKDNSIQWISWVDSGTVKPDFHVPESFGVFKLEE